MAIREDVVLVADGGDITVGRRTATFVYGRFDVALPEGMDQVETDPRLQDGFIYRPSEDIAPFDIGFIRQDVTVNLDVQQSDLELAVDTAQGVAGGDVFFERDIGPAGLGDFIPGKHFENGDLVNVELWSKRMLLPATADDWVADGTRGPHGTRVHVGGQLVSDPEGLQRHNAERQREVNADKRDLERRARDAKRHSENTRAGLTGSPDGDISDAIDSPATPIGAVNDRANTALEETKKVRDTLAGDGANDGDLVAQLASVNAELIRLGVEQQPSLLLAFVGLSTKLWEAQQVINAMHDERIAENEEQIAEIRTLSEQLDVVQKELVDRANPVLSNGDDGQFFERSQRQLTALGSWVGQVHVTEENASPQIVQIPLQDGSRTISLQGWPSAIGVIALVSQEVMMRRVVSLVGGPVDIPASRLVRPTGMAAFTTPIDGRYTVNGWVEWNAAQFLSEYEIGVWVNGRKIKKISRTHLGPLIGHARRTQRVTAEGIEAKQGETMS
ncbi:hypothetical protein [Corynebacterium cystitidis]|uniref:hypothetical protein n=1 Tax=Corynebacterium cystitidis TaxID=35757 RepID=UPI00211E75D7|nr:hypothetical protein [Corynebacterium cystitidis]